MALPVQRCFEDLGVPLSEVPFCVIDLETTGGSPTGCGITEIGALRFRGGEPDGTFHTLVNPQQEIPAFITILTGITQAMVIEAPPINRALPALLEFLGDAVVVGHNVRFDLSFLNAAAERLGYGRLPNRSVDTYALARRLLRSELRDLRLGTLAAFFRSPVTPNHRAFEDARATADVLWGLLERAGTIGITHLEDLLQLPTARGGAHYGKIRLADSLPRRPGVYLFRDRAGEVFYVGKATNLRTRVRAYFYGDDRRRADQMLRELDAVDHRVCATDLEAEVAELRLIRAHNPRHNRRSRPAPAPHWLRLTNEAYPRLALARGLRPGEGLLHLGPFRGQAAARLVAEAVWDALPLRRCSGPPGRRAAPCAAAQLGVALCPCDGTLDPAAYQPVVERLVAGVEDDPALLLRPLADKVTTLARDGRFEEAGWVRDRHHALARALERRRAWQALARAGLICAEHPEGGGALIDHGRLVSSWDGSRPPLLPLPDTAPGTPPEVPADPGDAEEADIVWRWLAKPGVRLLEASGELALPARPVARLERVDL
ncbi:MAG: DEDD exonuclease domain-containing protein [Acidimicrobiia bacterium]|nr:DEDD exonuclease domain-containing protein [Acidimicrobiia bacterium]